VNQPLNQDVYIYVCICTISHVLYVFQFTSAFRLLLWMRFTLSYACVLHAAHLTGGDSPTAPSGVNVPGRADETKVGARLTSLRRRRRHDADHPSPRAHVRRMHADTRLATKSPCRFIRRGAAFPPRPPTATAIAVARCPLF